MIVSGEEKYSLRKKLAGSRSDDSIPTESGSCRYRGENIKAEKLVEVTNRGKYKVS